ncbi:MAG: insulinase family protein [Alistipes sp.]|nr:insulinase family protein [Alistipes sp.]
MKKLLFLLVALTVSVSSIFAQEATELPLDRNVRMGKLDNGMSYIIRHNEKPKGQANFYIYHDVGAIQEADDQQGLAHFLEHMAFNGTKNLPGKAIIERLEAAGCQFGRNLNAATSWDYTQYTIMDCPVTDETIDLALLILHDWSQFIALQPKEIDSERGVIMEELRTRDGASFRAQNDMLKHLFKGSLYERRNLIGYLDDLKSFDHTALESFYKKWYRPEYQTVIIVGDIDVDQIETKLRSIMADIPASPADAAQKEVVTVPTTEEPIISIFTDAELTQSSVMMFARREAMPKYLKSTYMGYTYDIINTFACIMANNRFSEIAEQADAPFSSGGMSEGGIGICPTMEATMFTVTAHEGRTDEAFRAMYTEMERIRRHGFTAEEFERAKQVMLSWAERQYANRNDITNYEYTERYLEHCKSGAPIMDAESEWQLCQMIINNLTVEQLNASYKEIAAPNENLVILVRSPKRENIAVPTTEEILSIRAEVEASEIEPYEDNVVIRPLIAANTKLRGSKVKRCVTNESLGYTEWTLKNGITVVVRPTTLKADEVQIAATAKGGKSLLTDRLCFTGGILPSVMMQSGIADFSATELEKALTGKHAYTNMSVDNYIHSAYAGGSPKDIETILQLLYLNFTAPRFNQTDLDNIKNIYVPTFRNLETDPWYVMSKSYLNTIFKDNPRRQAATAADYEALNIVDLEAVHKSLFCYADDFRFVIVGNVDLDTLRPLVERYIGSLPTSKSVKYEVVDDGVRRAQGEEICDFNVKMQQPKVSVSLNYNGTIEDNAKNRMVLNLLRRALDSRYMVSIREEKGGTYGVSVGGNIERYPIESYTLTVEFDTNEALADELIEICDAELRKIAEEGPIAEDIAKAKEFLQKNYTNIFETNGGWISAINYWYDEGYNFKDEYLGIVEGVTADDIRAMAAKILEDGNRTLIIMRPKAE